ncbi:Six-hairpin glycosidase-like protein [Aspergillus novoparasiticus]|uniref:Six-hairpin glycosidase-like protein n=1 Tax=Aspergillus novoparasiticus TaxID=986946 RepID=A0A5N6EQ02_9EURO|nr:Six-hairpin glycosidase-like protein [Aspergillus novoparasiticus]
MRLPWSAWLLSPALLAVACYGVPYNEYILAPASRHLVPFEVLEVNGSVTNPSSLTQSTGGNATFNGPASVTFDFGRNIAGIVSLEIGSSSSRDAFIGVTFTESSLWISSQACDATADSGLDSPLWFPVGRGAGTYTADKKHNRGAFRYMTLVANTTAAVSVCNVQINYTAAPSQDLRAYTGYFHSNDELLNRVWYAGAYTNQICTIDPTTGDALPFLGVISSDSNITLPETNPWYSNYTISNGSSTLTDGAKRDRLIWPGDMSIALESVSVSTADLYSVRTALETLLSQQRSDGRLPYASEPFLDLVSYTYHLHSLIGVSYYYRHSGDRAWLSKYWGQYQKGLQWALSSVDNTGLANITASSDWLRFGMGGHNIEANAILYFVLNEAQELSQAINNHTNANWTKIASGIKSATNKNLWDASNGLYKDNETTTLHPQDGNAWAIKANLTLSTNQSSTISSALSSRWGNYGAPAPEAADAVSPFIGGFELQAHFLANQPQKALDLIRLQWGFMLDDPRMTNSTFIEGYSTDGTLHYAPYTNDARVSHAHGWSTGPTAALSFFAAGLHLTGPAGATWRFAPQPGDLTSVDAGYTTALGLFSTTFKRSENGDYQELSFTTPQGTTGDVDLAGAEGTLVSADGERVSLVKGTATGITGGSWNLEVASQ